MNYFADRPFAAAGQLSTRETLDLKLAILHPIVSLDSISFRSSMLRVRVAQHMHRVKITRKII